MVSSHPYLNNLTPLRGVAALWVAMFHYGAQILSFGHPGQSTILGKGYMGVDLFFIMSGFIMLHVYGERLSRQLTKDNLQRFAIARFARIYPLHIFTLTLLIIIHASSGQWNWVYDPDAIPTNILLLQSFGIHKIYTWNIPAWSLSAECAAYVVFPFLALFLYQRKRLAYLVLPIFVILTYIALLYWLPPRGFGNLQRLKLHKLDVTYDYGFLRGIAGFTLGMLFYGAYSLLSIRRVFSRDSIALIAIITMLLCLYQGVDWLIVVAFSLLVLSFACNSGYLHQLCSVRWIQFIGKVSYSIYLIQGLASLFFDEVLDLSGLRRVLPPVETASFFPAVLYSMAFLSVLVGLSALTYYGIENPCRNFINRNLMPLKSVPE